MILGIGTDIVNINRIQSVLVRHGKRFLDRVYTDFEQAEAARMSDNVGILAKRWAAKEACSKALGTGMRQGIAWKDIEVRSRSSGMPFLTLYGGAKRRLTGMLPPEQLPFIHLSMSDDRPCALAFVVIEAVCGNFAKPNLGTDS